jgi:lipopolysaccharide heptosyltransferase II
MHNSQSPKRLLAVNLNYLGDALFTTPALATLRARFPEATLDVLAGGRAETLLRGNPNIDRLLVRPPRGGTARSVMLARTLREGNYDAVLLFQSTLTNALITWLNRVPVRIGFAQDGCGPFLTHAIPTLGDGEHIVDAYTRLANAFGGPSPLTARELRLSIMTSAEDEAFASDFLQRHELSGAGVGPVVGLVVGATRPQKRWPEEYFARLADRLAETAGVSCILLGGPEEKESAERILAQTTAPVVSAVGQTTEKQLAALAARLSVIVSGDSGPLHIATAMNTPVVALFGSTHPSDTGPWSPPAGDGFAPAPAIVFYDSLHCAPCRKNPTCDGRYDCLRTITPERVAEAVSRLLNPAYTLNGVGYRGGNRTNGNNGAKGRNGHVALPVVAPEDTFPVSARPASCLSGPIKSILVMTKHRYFGDSLIAIPMLRETRNAFPEANIALVTGATAATVLENSSYVDTFIPINLRRKATGLFTFVQLMNKIRREQRPDLCLLPDRSLRSALGALLSGARYRVGFDTEGRGLSLTHRIPYVGDKHEIESCLDLARLVAAEPPGQPYSPETELWVTEAERKAALRFLAEKGIVPEETLLIGMQPGANDAPVREWGAARYAELADRLAAEYGARILLFGGPDERESSERAAELMKPETAPLVLTGTTKLREALALISYCRAWVGNDSGLLHCAIALGLPTVGIYGPTKAGRWSYESLDAGKHRGMVVYPDTPCGRPETIRRCLDAIPVDDVFAATVAALRTDDGGTGVRGVPEPSFRS